MDYLWDVSWEVANTTNLSFIDIDIDSQIKTHPEMYTQHRRKH